jgi:hypothetical protein
VSAAALSQLQGETKREGQPMNTHPEGEPDRTEPEASREQYAPPQLVRHGTIEDLTRGVTFTQQVGDQNSIG